MSNSPSLAPPPQLNTSASARREDIVPQADDPRSRTVLNPMDSLLSSGVTSGSYDLVLEPVASVVQLRSVLKEDDSSSLFGALSKRLRKGSAIRDDTLLRATLVVPTRNFQTSMTVRRNALVVHAKADLCHTLGLSATEFALCGFDIDAGNALVPLAPSQQFEHLPESLVSTLHLVSNDSLARRHQGKSVAGGRRGSHDFEPKQHAMVMRDARLVASPTAMALPLLNAAEVTLAERLDEPTLGTLPPPLLAHSSEGSLQSLHRHNSRHARAPRCAHAIYRAVARNYSLVAKVFAMKNANERAVDAAFNEVMLVSKLNHPNVVRYISHRSLPQSGEVHVYSELYVLTLASLIAERREAAALLEVSTVHAVASGLAAALGYLHTAFDSPVIHRDVKPAKVMMRLVMRNVGTAEPVRSQFVAALGGFGTAVHLNDEARVEIDDSDPVRSKLRAPEPTCSPALDIYSLGIVMHEVLTLNIPYYNELLRGAVPIKSVLAPLRYVQAPPVDGALLDAGQAIAGLPYTLQMPEEGYAPYVAICNRCLAVDPLKRPSATQLAQRLAEMPEEKRARAERASDAAVAAAAAAERAAIGGGSIRRSHDDILGGPAISSNSSSTASLTRQLHGNDDDSDGDGDDGGDGNPVS